jgi:phosphoglycolate phosphatase
MASMIKGIIFDFDETLVDSLETYWQVFCYVARRLNLLAPLKEELASLLGEGGGLLEILSQVYPNLDETAILNCAEKMKEASRDVMKEFPITVKLGVKDLLRILKMNGIKIGLVTGRVFPSEQMWKELRDLSIDRFFDAVITGNDQPRKPAPDGIIACLEKLALVPQDCVIVGDAKADLIAGKRAGVRVIVLNNRENISGILASEKPDMIIDDITQLTRFLQQDAFAE